MAAPAFDTHDAVRKPRGAGIGDEAAEGIVEVVEEATSPLVTRDILRLELNELRSELRSELYRALWLFGAGIVAVMSGLMAAAMAVAAFVG